MHKANQRNKEHIRHQVKCGCIRLTVESSWITSERRSVKTLLECILFQAVLLATENVNCDSIFPQHHSSYLLTGARFKQLFCVVLTTASISLRKSNREK